MGQGSRWPRAPADILDGQLALLSLAQNGDDLGLGVPGLFHGGLLSSEETLTPSVAPRSGGHATAGRSSWQWTAARWSPPSL